MRRLGSLPPIALPLIALLSISSCGGSEQVGSTAEPGLAGGDDELADQVTPVEQSGGSLDCVRTDAYVQRSSGGYNHIVQIDNECEQVVRCEVTTDAAPDPVYGRVQPHDRAALTTYRGGMTTTFTPNVSCELQ